MSRKPYDPLATIPTPEAIRARLTATLTLAERLRVLLDLSERLRLPPDELAALIEEQSAEEAEESRRHERRHERRHGPS